MLPLGPRLMPRAQGPWSIHASPSFFKAFQTGTSCSCALGLLRWAGKLQDYLSTRPVPPADVCHASLTRGYVLVGLQILPVGFLPLGVRLRHLRASPCLVVRLFPTLVFKYCTSTLPQRKTRTSDLKNLRLSASPWHRSSGLMHEVRLVSLWHRAACLPPVLLVVRCHCSW